MRHALTRYGRVDAYAALKAARKALILNTWGSSTLPTTLANSVTRSFTGPSYRRDYASGALNCSRVDQYAITTAGNVARVANVLYPPSGVSDVNKLLVMVGGHCPPWDLAPPSGDSTNEVGVIDLFLQAGWKVLDVAMPEWDETGGASTNPISVTFPDTTVHSLSGHDYSTAEAAGVNTLRLFIDAILIGINQAIADFHPSRIVMAGLSGGGWSTDMMAAVDPRILRSYPTCGSIPFNLAAAVTASGGNPAPDYEQAQARPWWSVIPAIGSFDPKLTLYALGCFDTGRRRVQTLADSDPVFKASAVHTQINAYAAQVNTLVPRGQHSVRIDPYAGGYHTFPPATCAAILADAQLAT